MFFQGASSVLLLDRYGNDMLCSILFLSLGFDILTDYFNGCPSCRQKTEILAPECFFPKFFPDFRKLFFQQPAAGTFISIDKFTEFRFSKPCMYRAENNSDKKRRGASASSPDHRLLKFLQSDH